MRKEERKGGGKEERKGRKERKKGSGERGGRGGGKGGRGGGRKEEGEKGGREEEKKEERGGRGEEEGKGKRRRKRVSKVLTCMRVVEPQRRCKCQRSCNALPIVCSLVSVSSAMIPRRLLTLLPPNVYVARRDDCLLAVNAKRTIPSRSCTYDYWETAGIRSDPCAVHVGGPLSTPKSRTGRHTFS